MTRLYVALGIAIAALGGCAAADPTGGAFGEPVASAPKKSRCPAGQMLTCELKSPNRVSDGRYGYRGDKQKRCSCVPEEDILDLGQATLPGDQR